MSLFGRRERREIAEQDAYINRLREQRDKAVRAQGTAETNRGQVLRQNVDLDEKYVAVCIVNERLTSDLVDLRAKLTASVRAESGLARQIHAMAQPIEPTDAYMGDLERLTRERDAEKARADEAEARLSTASPAEVEAWERRVKAHDAWTPSANPDKRPMEGGSGRPIHPATELRQALERCRALQARLDGYGKPVTS